MKAPSSEQLLFILAILMTGAYLIHPDDTTKTLSVMVVGGFLTVVKQVVDSALPSLKAAIFDPKNAKPGTETTVTEKKTGEQ